VFKMDNRRIILIIGRAERIREAQGERANGDDQSNG